MADRPSGGSFLGKMKGLKRNGFLYFLFVRDRTQLKWIGGSILIVWVMFFAGVDFAQSSKGGMAMIIVVIGPPLFLPETWVRYRRFRKKVQSEPKGKVE